MKSKILILVLSLFANHSNLAKGEAVWVPWIKLLASPEHFDGEEVVVNGWFLYLGEDCSAVFMSREMAKDVRAEFGLSLDPKKMKKIMVKNSLEWGALKGKFLTISGTFSMSAGSKLGLNAYGFKDISWFIIGQVEKGEASGEYSD